MQRHFSIGAEMESSHYFRIVLIVIMIIYLIHIVFGIDSSKILPLLVLLLGAFTFGFIMYFGINKNENITYVSIFSIFMGFFFIGWLFFLYVGMPE